MKEKMNQHGVQCGFALWYHLTKNFHKCLLKYLGKLMFTTET